MPTTQQPEVERTFDVDQDTVIPDLRGVHGIADVGAPQTTHLKAAYLDTSRLDLARAHITLRRREGGSDAGWHLKMPSGADDERIEHRCPPDESASPPEVLVDQVSAVAGDRPLGLVARVDTTRTETLLLDRAGRVLAVFCDDEVTAEAVPPRDDQDATASHGPAEPQPDPVTRWREWEIELVDGDRPLLAAASRVVVAAGARPGASASKLAHALGDRLNRFTDHDPPQDSKTMSTADLLRLRLRRQVRALRKEDRRVRSGEDTGVHQMRIATRRLRSALATFAPILEQGTTESLREDLRWLGVALGGARDAEVLHARLLAELATLRHDELVGPVKERMDLSFGAEYAEGRRAALDALDSPRCSRLLTDLEGLAREPPMLASGGLRATEVVPELLRRDTRRFTRATKLVVHEHDPAARDEALHEARKKAKRLRYLAESVIPVYGKRARKVMSRAKKVQEALGVHQDAVMARARLAALATEAQEAGEPAATYARLSELEAAAAARAEGEYVAVLPRLYRGAIKDLSHP